MTVLFYYFLILSTILCNNFDKSYNTTGKNSIDIYVIFLSKNHAFKTSKISKLLIRKTQYYYKKYTDNKLFIHV